MIFLSGGLLTHPIELDIFTRSLAFVEFAGVLLDGPDVVKRGRLFARPYPCHPARSKALPGRLQGPVLASPVLRGFAIE